MCRGSALPIHQFKGPVLLAAAPVLAAKNIPIQFSNVAEQFENSFKETFTSSDKKAHFNNLPDEFKVVDGAKGVWCNVLLVDALISLLTVKSFKKSVRRAFNQDRVLFDCISKELASVDPTAFAEIMSKKPTTESCVEISSEVKGNKKDAYQITLGSLGHPWNSLDDLRNSLAESPHSKAKAKYTGTVALLTNHEELHKFNYNFQKIIHAVIMRVLFELPIPLEINPAPATRTAPSSKKAVVCSSASSSSESESEAPKQQKRKRACDGIKIEGVAKKQAGASAFRQAAMNISTFSPLNVAIVSPALSPVASLSMQIPRGNEEDLCLMDDFFFDEDCCDEFLNATFSPASFNNTNAQQSECAVVSPVEQQQCVPVEGDFSTSLDTLRAYFNCEDDWLDLMHCGAGRDEDERSVSEHSEGSSSAGDCSEEFSLSADECSLLMELNDSRDEGDLSDSDCEGETQFGEVSFPVDFFCDRQYHSCEDLDVLDFPLLSGVLSKPPTPRMAGQCRASRVPARRASPVSQRRRGPVHARSAQTTQSGGGRPVGGSGSSDDRLFSGDFMMSPAYLI